MPYGGPPPRRPVPTNELGVRPKADDDEHQDHVDELRVEVVHRDLDEQLLPAGAGNATA